MAVGRIELNDLEDGRLTSLDGPDVLSCVTIYEYLTYLERWYSGRQLLASHLIFR